MYTLIAENRRGKQLELTNNDNYDVVEVTGITSPTATINTSSIAGSDGSIFNSSKIGERNIVITLNIKPPIESNRIALYDIFQTKKYIKIYYRNEHRDVYTEGYVESLENNIFTQLQQPQISIICPSPFWTAVEGAELKFSKETALFEFPFSISSAGIEFSRLDGPTNTSIAVGNIETGGIIVLSATGDVVNPVFYNRTTQQRFKLSYSMASGDVITIDTNRGEKSVTLLRSGENVNILSARTTDSEWITFEPGENELSYDADSGSTDLHVSVSLSQKYIGV